MLIGFSEVEFTPNEGNIPGQMEAIYATERGEGVFADAAAFTSGDESVILISVDVLSFRARYADRIRRRISEATGVPFERVLVAAIHTHSGPALEYPMWLCPADEITAQNTADKIVEAGIAAWNGRVEATLGVGKGYNDRFNYNRDWRVAGGKLVTNPGKKYTRKELVQPMGTVDNSVNVMRVDGVDGRVLGFIVNYANHPDNMPFPRTGFGADFAGVIKTELRKKYGEGVNVLFFNGTAGDINCVDFKGKTHTDYIMFEGHKAHVSIGTGVAETVIEVNERIKTKYAEVNIQSRDEKHPIPRRFKTDENYAWAADVLKRAKTEKVNGGELAFAIDYMNDDSGFSKTVDFEIHTIQIGPWAIVGLPSEICTMVGMKIKAYSPFNNTVVFQLANGTNGYITYDEAHHHDEHGTYYEGRFATYNACTGDGSTDIISEGAIKQLRDMAEQRESIQKEFGGIKKC